MTKTFREKGWEFGAGVIIVIMAAAIIGYALIDECWRLIVRDMGAAVAAFAVVGASLIAYSGAIAKVRLDRHIEEMRERVAVRNANLKVHIAAAQLYEEAGNVSVQLREDLESRTGGPIAAADYILQEPTEMKEAWNNLDRLPTGCIGALRGIRLRLNRAAMILQRYDKTNRHDIYGAKGSLSSIGRLYAEVSADAEKLINATNEVIKERAADHRGT